MLSLEFADNGDFVAGGLTFDRGDGVFLSTDASVGLYTVPPIQGYMKNLAVRAPGSKRNERRNSVIHIVTRLIQ